MDPDSETDEDIVTEEELVAYLETTKVPSIISSTIKRIIEKAESCYDKEGVMKDLRELILDIDKYCCDIDQICRRSMW